MIADRGNERGRGRRRESESESESESEEIRVLHVDDEPDFSALVRTFLEREHEAISVVRADGAAAGLEVLERRRIDCIVSDFRMPETDGLAFLEAVRERAPSVPFILFTGSGSESVVSEALEAGATDYLRKGMGREQYVILANRIANAVERRRTERALEESERRRSTLVRTVPGFVYRSVPDSTWSSAVAPKGNPNGDDGSGLDAHLEFVSEGTEAVTGYRPAAFTNGTVTLAECIPEADRRSVRTVVRDAVANREPFEVTYRFTTREGRTKRLWERGHGIRSDDGELDALEGFVTDADREFGDRTLSQVALSIARSVSRSRSRSRPRSRS